MDVNDKIQATNITDDFKNKTKNWLSVMLNTSIVQVGITRTKPIKVW